MQGQRVGYSRTTTAKLTENGRELLRTANFTHSEMQRGGQKITQDMTLTSVDTPTGGLVRFETRIASGTGDIVSKGVVQAGQLLVETATLGRTQSQKMPWQPEWGGMFAPDRSLREQPLQPGEKRTVRGLLPIFNSAGDTHLQAVDYETVDLPAGKKKLLKVKTAVDIGGQKIESFLWLDERGQSLKSLIPSINEEAVRTTRQEALRTGSGGSFDLLTDTTVRLTGTLPHPTTTRRAVYRARLKAGPIAGLFSECLSQQVQPIDERTAELTILAIRPAQPAMLDGPQPAPTPDDLAANNFIQSDDQQVAALAAQIAPSETDPWKLACVLEKYVDHSIRLKNFSQAFATAAEVARSLEGDCTEHAVLLAALCRQRKIPARVAFGLVYYPPQKGFAYHMWNEIWIKDRWIPLDSTLGLGGIGADHIKLGHSNLAGGSPLADLLAVIQVFGRLELEVLAAE